jgi:hypothetical protein
MSESKAIIIQGGELCERTLLADNIASSRGKFVVTTMAKLMNPFGLGSLAKDQPDTIIVEDFDSTENSICKIKPMVANKECIIEVKGKDPSVAKIPNFILCCKNNNHVKLHKHDRRFSLITIGKLKQSVYAITKSETGPRGHGTPGEPYLCLATDGEYFEIGNARPLFTSKEEAEIERKKFDEYDFYKVISLELK